ncbi:hypothetical protein DFP73DRAFT_561677 [Morchella snyderi]|nr:hypothetical protein DFP73DRAFT_561677 [Morchella snyderi]
MLRRLRLWGTVWKLVRVVLVGVEVFRLCISNNACRPTLSSAPAHLLPLALSLYLSLCSSGSGEEVVWRCR